MLQINSIYSDQAKTLLPHEGQNIRVAFLYADTVIISGSTYVLIDFEDQYATANNNQFIKIKGIETFCEQLNPPMPLDEFRQIMRDIKSIRARKHKNKVEIVLLKRGEKLLDALFEDCMNYYRSLIKPSGLSELIKMEEEELKLLCTSSKHPENNQDYYTPYSEILKNKWGDKDEVYAFTNPFFDFVKENNINMQPFETTTADTGIVLFPMPDMTILTYYSHSELKLIKQQLNDELTPVRLALGQWSKDLKKSEFSSSQFESYRQYFSAQLQQPLKLLTQKMAVNEALKKVTDFYRGTTGSVNYLAIASAKTVWDYMRWNDIVPEESMQVFRQNLPLGCNENKAVLFSICNPFKKDIEEEPREKKHLVL